MQTMWDISETGIVVNGDLNRKCLSKDGWNQLSEQHKQQFKKAEKVTLHFNDDVAVDSAGLAWVLNWVRDAKKNGIETSLSNVPVKLTQLAKLSSVYELLPIQEDSE